MRIAVYVVPVALAIYALFDLYRSEPYERAGLQSLPWALIILVLPVVGPIAWIFVSTTRRREAAASPARPDGPRLPTQSAPRPEPVAPDDDADFLRDLEQQWQQDDGPDADAGARDPDQPAP